jgi:hypothetical protein
MAAKKIREPPKNVVCPSMNDYESLSRLCECLHEAEYVYYDEGLLLLFVWNGSRTVNIWIAGEGVISECDVISYSDKPTRPGVRASIRRRLADYEMELNL